MRPLHYGRGDKEEVGRGDKEEVDQGDKEEVGQGDKELVILERIKSICGVFAHPLNPELLAVVKQVMGTINS